MPRLITPKTYKIYIGGKFVRSESGKYYKLSTGDSEQINICRSSPKDIKNAVQQARNAFGNWSGRSGYNRGQILYRIAETMEGRSSQFIRTLKLQGCTTIKAEQEVERSIDNIIYYAGWCDKYQQIYSTVNPVEGPYFNYSIPEPTGVVGIIPPLEYGLSALTGIIAPVILGGNTMIAVASEKYPLTAIELAEVLNSSDVPSGVVNIMTGYNNELIKTISTHLDVNAMVFADIDQQKISSIKKNASSNIKRISVWNHVNWNNDSVRSPYKVMDLQEVKTVWQPDLV